MTKADKSTEINKHRFVNLSLKGFKRSPVKLLNKYGETLAQRLKFPPTLLSCSSRFFRALNRTEQNQGFFYLLIKGLPSTNNSNESVAVGKSICEQIAQALLKHTACNLRTLRSGNGVDI